MATLREPDGQGAAVVRFSPDGSLLAVTGKQEVAPWRVGSWSRVALLPANQALTSLAFSPDGRTLAAGGNNAGMILWDVGPGRLLAVLGGQTGPNREPTFSPDGRTLATVTAEREVRLWHVPTRRELFTLYGHNALVQWLWFESPQRLHVRTHP